MACSTEFRLLHCSTGATTTIKSWPMAADVAASGGLPPQRRRCGRGSLRRPAPSPSSEKSMLVRAGPPPYFFDCVKRGLATRNRRCLPPTRILLPLIRLSLSKSSSAQPSIHLFASLHHRVGETSRFPTDVPAPAELHPLDGGRAAALARKLRTMHSAGTP